MPEGPRAQAQSAPARGQPHAGCVTCSHCGTPVDPLRADRVAVFGERFHYFCSAACRAAFRPEPEAPRTRPRPDDEPQRPPPGDVERATSESVQKTEARGTPAISGAQVAASLGASALLAEGLGAPLGAPAWLGTAAGATACGALMVELLRSRPDRSSALSPWAVVGPVVATMAAVAAALLGTPGGEASVTAAVTCLVAAVGVLLERRGGAERRRGAERVIRALDLAGRRVAERPGASGSREARAADGDAAGRLKPGEEIVVDAGDVVPADAVVVAGTARLRPWLDAPGEVTAREGAALLAGARVSEGTLRAVVRWTGVDRAWARLTQDPQRRADEHTEPAKLARRLSTTGAIGAAVLAALAATMTELSAVIVASRCAAAFAGLASVGLARLAAVRALDCVHDLLSRGVLFRGSEAIDRAGRTTTAVFCSQGTLERGEPRVASIEPLEGTTTEALLALVSGAHGGLSTPVSVALQRAAREHRVVADATRSPTHLPGLGVTAVSATGSSLVVGSRALLLSQHVSVAATEGRILELETLGRRVLLVALGGKLVGLLALQDVLRPGARAAVQQLLDASVEPVWLTADSRPTAEALAARLGVAHVRPEVSPEDQNTEIERLARAGQRVAVIGRAPEDDLALSSSELSINMAIGAGVLERWDVEVASGDPADAAAAIWLPRRLREDTQRALVTVCGPAAVGTLLLSLGGPAWVAPLGSLAGAALSWHRFGRRRALAQN